MTDNDIETLRAAFPGWSIVRAPDYDTGVCLWPASLPQPNFWEFNSYAAINAPDASTQYWEAFSCNDGPGESKYFDTLVEAAEYATGYAPSAP